MGAPWHATSAVLSWGHGKALPMFTVIDSSHVRLHHGFTASQKGEQGSAAVVVRQGATMMQHGRWCGALEQAAAYACVHNVLAAHAAAVARFRALIPHGRISINLNCDFGTPYNSGSTADQVALWLCVAGCVAVQWSWQSATGIAWTCGLGPIAPIVSNPMYGCCCEEGACFWVFQ